MQAGLTTGVTIPKVFAIAKFGILFALPDYGFTYRKSNGDVGLMSDRWLLRNTSSMSKRYVHGTFETQHVVKKLRNNLHNLLSKKYKVHFTFAKQLNSPGKMP